jgi:hypothetical protein
MQDWLVGGGARLAEMLRGKALKIMKLARDGEYPFSWGREEGMRT